ncbi:MAG: Ig-like domain-containing protein [Acidobacteria bacterium]|nr:Ig-like domain-containing protein [Acidobacteriota bacterium]
MNRSLVAVAIVLWSAHAAGQPPTRIATTAEALVASPGFFHGRQVVIRHGISQSSDLARLESRRGAEDVALKRPVFLFWKDPPGRAEGEIRGEFWDLGRLQEGDARFTPYDFRPVLEAVNGGQWPPRDRVFVLINAVLVDAAASPEPTIRTIVMSPEAYVGRPVTIIGRFRGRNLYGDVAQPLNKARWDFVLQSAEGALWVTGVRPRGKGFDLDPGARVDTGRWLEVSGTVRQSGSQRWIEATAVRQAAAPAETPVEISVPAAAPEPPPKVIFSAPVPDEPDVPRSATVRIQFSRDMDRASFRDRVRAAYAQATKSAPAVTWVYNEGQRALEIKFVDPLERFQTVRIELLEGITAFDGQQLAPWTLTFTTGS